MNRDFASLVLRAGLSFAFLYPPWNALSNPDSWLGYFPAFTRGVVPDPVLLHGFGVMEVVIAVWILSGWRIFWPSTAATLLLLTIVVFDFSNFEVVFRDISIAAIGIALAIQNRHDVFKKDTSTSHGI